MQNNLHFAFFDLPDHTRITTTLAIAEGLVDREVKLDYYCLDNSRELVESVGANFCKLPSFKEKIQEETLQYRVIEYSLDAVPLLLPQLQKNRPALIIFTAKCLWAAVLAEYLQIPKVCIHTNYLLPTQYFPALRVFFSSYRPSSFWRHLRLYRRDLKLWNSLVKMYNLKYIQQQDLFKWQPNCINLKGDLNLVYVAKEFQEKLGLFNSSYHFIGPCYNDRAFDGSADFELVSIYIALGSVKHYNQNMFFYSQCIKAFTGTSHKVLMAVGNDIEINSLGEIPANITVVNYAPQLNILRYAKVFITHGGTNSVWEALLYGVPLLVFPQGGDQHLVANRVDQLNLGIWIRNPRISAQCLLELTEKMMEDTFIYKNVLRMGDAFRQAGGTACAVTKIMDFANQFTQLKI